MLETAAGTVASVTRIDADPTIDVAVLWTGSSFPIAAALAAVDALATGTIEVL